MQISSRTESINISQTEAKQIPKPKKYSMCISLQAVTVQHAVRNQHTYDDKKSLMMVQH